MILTVETNNSAKFEVLLNFLRINGYKVNIESNTLSEKDWILPGKTATDKEIEILASEMDLDSDEGTEANVFFNDFIKEINTWK